MIGFVLCLLSFFSSSMSEKTYTLHRIPRQLQLLFPNSTLFQFNAGLGTPTPNKMINVNWAFQANFQLPWNRSQVPNDLIWANSGYDGTSRKKRETEERVANYESDAKLYHFYQYVEEVLNSYGHNGTACVLQTLCQLGAEPLHSDDKEDLLHEIASYALNPNNDIHYGLKESQQEYVYIEAFRIGQRGDICSNYETCSISVIERFSKVHGE